MGRIRIRFVEIRPGPHVDDPEPVQIRLSFIDSMGQSRVWPARRPYTADLRPDAPVAVDEVVFEQEYPEAETSGGRTSASQRVSMEKQDPAGKPGLEVWLMWGLLVLLGGLDGVFFGWLFDSFLLGGLGVVALGGLGWMVGWMIGRRVRHLYPREIYCQNKYLRTWYEGGAGERHECRVERGLPATVLVSGRKAAVELVFAQE